MRKCLSIKFAYFTICLLPHSVLLIMCNVQSITYPREGCSLVIYMIKEWRKWDTSRNKGVLINSNLNLFSLPTPYWHNIATFAISALSLKASFIFFFLCNGAFCLLRMPGISQTIKPNGNPNSEWNRKITMDTFPLHCMISNSCWVKHGRPLRVLISQITLGKP